MFTGLARLSLRRPFRRAQSLGPDGSGGTVLVVSTGMTHRSVHDTGLSEDENRVLSRLMQVA